jgi:hypothetical protein
MQKPLSLPLVAPLPPNFMAQPLQNLQVEMTSNILSRRYKLVVHQTGDVKEFRDLFSLPLVVQRKFNDCSEEIVDSIFMLKEYDGKHEISSKQKESLPVFTLFVNMPLLKDSNGYSSCFIGSHCCL